MLFRSPSTLTHARAVLEAASAAEGTSVTVTGLLSDQGKAFAYRQEGYAFPHAFITNPEVFITEVNRSLDVARTTAQALNHATLRLAAEVVSRGGEREHGGEHDEDSARTDYQLAERIASAAAWQAFLAKHPSGFYADLARAQLEKLGVTAANPPAAEPAPGGMANQVHLLRA